MDRAVWRGLFGHGDELLERSNLRCVPPFGRIVSGRGRVPEGKLEGGVVVVMDCGFLETIIGDANA